MNKAQASTIFCFHSSSDLYGASRIFLQTVSLFKDAGYSPHVYLSEDGPLSVALKRSGVRVSILRLGIVRRKYLSIPGLVNRAFYLLKAMIVLSWVVVKERPAAIYNNASSILAPAVVGKIFGIKHVWHIHEIVLSPSFFVKFIGFCLSRFSTMNIVVSSATYNHWISVSPSLKRDEKMVMIHNGISSDTFKRNPGFNRDGYLAERGISLPQGAVVVGMMARVHFWKGQTYFLDIAEQLLKLESNIVFLMAGDAFPGYEYLYEEINGKILSLGLESHVFQLGYLGDPSEFYQSLDLFIVPSILPDPLPTVVLEAMLFELPVAATNHGGTTDMIVNGSSGYLIPWDDPQKAAASIKPFFTDFPTRKQMGKIARNRVIEKFSPEEYGKAILRLFGEICR